MICIAFLRQLNGLGKHTDNVNPFIALVEKKYQPEQLTHNI